MPRQDIHTVPSTSGSGWVNKKGGRVMSRHLRKETAVARGRRMARVGHVEHVIHNEDGRIGEKNSYGPDPMPPRDGE